MDECLAKRYLLYDETTITPSENHTKSQELLMTEPDDVLVVDGLRKHFGPTVALQDAKLRLLPGEVHALVGENGSGKSTLVKILSGVHRPDAGAIWAGGRLFAPRTPAQAL